MKTKDLTNQTPEQENTPATEENAANSVDKHQEIENSPESDETQPEDLNEPQNTGKSAESPQETTASETVIEPEQDEISFGETDEIITEIADSTQEFSPPQELGEPELETVVSVIEVQTEETPEMEVEEISGRIDEIIADTAEKAEEEVKSESDSTTQPESESEVAEEPAEAEKETLLAEETPEIVADSEPEPKEEKTETLVAEQEEIAATALEEIAEEEKPAEVEATEEPVVIDEEPAEVKAVETIEEAEKDESLKVAALEETAEEIKPAEVEAAEEPVVVDEEPAEVKVVETTEEAEKEETLKVAAQETGQKDQADEEEEDEDEESEESEEIYQNLSRAELVDLIETTVQEPDVQAIKVKVALIKVAYLQKEKEEEQAQYDIFLKDGGIPEDYAPEPDQLSERFQMAFNIYREKKQRYNEDLEKEKLTNLEAKKKILEELKVLIGSEETLKKTYDEFKTLQDQWKQIGMVPKNEVNQLWQNYHFLVEKFFDKVKINKELKDLDLKKNMERKIELCEKAEELLIESSILKSFKQLQQYHEEWKEVGPVPQDKRDEIWERFKIASDQINDRRREYYNKKQNELESNYLAKSALCEKAEKLISTTPETLRQWQNRTNEINDLLRVWKTIGLAPKKVNNEVWVRFKTCLDSHFTSYKEFLSRMKDYQLNNYNLKLDLCAQAEAIKNSTDWRNTTQELIQLQREWKSIGPVPRKHSDKIWKRFRTACDEFFQRKSDYFSSLAEVEQTNLKKKEDLIKKLEEFEFSDNRSQNLETLKNFQREWLEIGHVPIKEKDRLQNAFRSVLNKHFGKLKIDASEINALNYKNRLESIRDMPDAGRVLNRERNSLQIGINKLQEDIMLWENNIGYLAESKNANIVKVEFQKKIDQAKQELALMEAKLRYLKEI